MNKTEHELNEREPKEFQDAAKAGKVKWQKTKNPMTHLRPKKKKRK